MYNVFYRITQRIHKKLPSQAIESDSLPLHPGVQAGVINPALEFIKAVCKVKFYFCMYCSNCSQELSKKNVFVENST